MGQSRAEQETIIRWDEAEQVVHVWSASPRTWRKCTRMGLPHHRETMHDGEVLGRFYAFPLARLTWRARAVDAKKGRGNPEALAAARLRKAKSQ